MTSPREGRSEGHVAVSFGDRDGNERWQELRAFLDGRDVTTDCTEANVDEGWVMLIEGSKCEPVKVHGTVRLEGIIRPAPERGREYVRTGEMP